MLMIAVVCIIIGLVNVLLIFATSPTKSRFSRASHGLIAFSSTILGVIFLTDVINGFSLNWFQDSSIITAATPFIFAIGFESRRGKLTPSIFKIMWAMSLIGAIVGMLTGILRQPI
ncbi:hypothetical protein Sulac_0445 [Sulfobacillus acidophilus DSM 10332]|uniref:Uncharacterized protein n=1 Tax=Sulfobacillus acidophilus (strain ATCC 700253 / DSM 10332 / NAL) TaxID=679936 RepID=G8TYN8_SULAD|nr:hypothetical protein Sulac_0445 [Sulfobacillus acidophilus DSM 10332]